MPFDGREDGDVSRAIVQAVADHLDLDSLDLNPRLADVVDPDALERLVAPRSDGTVPPVSVSFTFHGQTVIVDAEAGVEIRPIAD